MEICWVPSQEVPYIEVFPEQPREPREAQSSPEQPRAAVVHTLQPVPQEGRGGEGEGRGGGGGGEGR